MGKFRLVDRGFATPDAELDKPPMHTRDLRIEVRDG